jgi:DDE superfamily endonuclease
LNSPVLLLMDNHDSHVSLPAIQYAKENGIIMLTFPPHCSHKLQPLDRSVYGPMKKYYNTACDAWMLANPGKPMTIYDVAGRLGHAFPLAMTPINIQAGFRVSGNWPFNRDIFTEDEFLSSYVTDRPMAISASETVSESGVVAGLPHIAAPTSMNTSVVTSVSAENASMPVAVPIVCETVSVARCPEAIPPTTLTRCTITPEQIKPFPKAGERKSSNHRKKGKSQVLTDTPVRMELEKQSSLKRAKFEAKMTAKTKTRGVSKSNRCKKQLPFSVSSTDNVGLLNRPNDIIPSTSKSSQNASPLSLVDSVNVSAVSRTVVRKKVKAKTTIKTETKARSKAKVNKKKLSSEDQEVNTGTICVILILFL